MQKELLSLLPSFLFRLNLAFVQYERQMAEHPEHQRSRDDDDDEFNVCVVTVLRY